jgi:CheY-like chemotaxis protein
VLIVADTGEGIPPELMDRIFDPFFTTKEVGKGTGLGLPTALTIVKSHRGFINVASEPGRGSEFKVFLPLPAASPPTEAGGSDAEVPRGHGELVLVVDDDPTIRLVTRATLNEEGYEAITAKDGAEALALCKQMKGRFQLVVTDMMMPLMDGTALIRALSELDPHLPVLAVSGLLDSDHATPAKAAPNVVFLQKPFTAEELLLAVGRMLHPTVSSKS